jgi:uroporphyrinogen-III decarboxylase
LSEVSSRERMLTALRCEVPDRVPCSFMIFGALKAQCRDYAEFIDRQVDMGLDAFVELPPRPPVVVNDHYNLHGLPVSYDPRVTIKEWREEQPGESWPILVKEYHTPAGVLRAEVRRTDDWRWGDHVPFLDDYIEPRSKKFLITEAKELSALQFLLVPPTDEEIRDFRASARWAEDLAAQHNLLVTGGWGVGADMLGWIFGLENMIFAPYDRPEFLREMLDIIAQWNRRRMEIILEEGVDLYIKRAWYETCGFWTPASYREFLYPILQQEVDLAHQYGAKFGYIITEDAMPLLDYFVQLGIDVVIGVDPREWDLETTKQKLGGKACLWGGVNGHLTVEQGDRAEVCRAVQRAMEVLAPGGGFILSPVDNVRDSAPLEWRENVQTLIDTWKMLTGQRGEPSSQSV